MKQIRKYACVTLVAVFMFTSCFNATVIPSEFETIKAKADDNLQDLQLMRDYVNQALFFIQSLDQKKGEAIEKFITEVIVRAENHVKNNKDEKFMQLDLARANFQAASYYNDKKNFIKAASFLQSGIEEFEEIAQQYPDDVFIRVYKIINALNTPAMFQDKEGIWNDLSFVIEQSTDMLADTQVLQNKLADVKAYRTENSEVDVTEEFKVVLSKVINGAIELYSDDTQKVTQLNDFSQKIN